MSTEILEKAQAHDEVWHAGDWGDMEQTSDKLCTISTVRGVFVNIDGRSIRKTYPEELFFKLEGLKVYMTHIGGYPGRYQEGIRDKLTSLKPNLYICGHSHICKVMRDKSLDLIHFNPGAMGNKGFHTKRTMISFAIDNGKLIDINLLEYDRNKE